MQLLLSSSSFILSASMASPYKSKIYLVLNVNWSLPKLSTLLTKLLSPHTKVPVPQVLYSVWKSLLLGTVRP